MPFHLIECVDVRLRQVAGVQVLIVVAGGVVVERHAGVAAARAAAHRGGRRLRRAGRLAAVLQRAVIVAGHRDARLWLQRQARRQAAGESLAWCGAANKNEQPSGKFKCVRNCDPFVLGLMNPSR